MPETPQNIFKIARITHENAAIKAFFDVNFEHEIFVGHFPGQPVVPGACLLQFVKEVLEDVLESTLSLKKAGQLKFINMIVPGENDLMLELSYKIIDDGISVAGKLTNAENICFKFRGSFIKVL